LHTLPIGSWKPGHPTWPGCWNRLPHAHGEGALVVRELLVRRGLLLLSLLLRLLVRFLSELLFLGEKDGLAFDSFDLQVKGEALHAALSGAPVAAQDKEIKAVTYHKLAIRQTQDGLAVNLVFDV